MSSKRWPAGTLSRALFAAHQSYPEGTAPDLARMVGCDPGSARVVLRILGIKTPTDKPQRIQWTPELKAAIIEGARAGTSITLLSERIGVAPASLALGALEVIRDLACASS
jgi:hypothetical protein